VVREVGRSNLLAEGVLEEEEEEEEEEEGEEEEDDNGYPCVAVAEEDLEEGGKIHPL